MGQLGRHTTRLSGRPGITWLIASTASTNASRQALPNGYYENNATRDALFNHAVSGSVMADFASQAQGVIAAAALTPSGEAGMVTVFLGSNDVCAPSLAAMTDPVVFEAQYRAGLDVLAASDATRNAQIHVSGLPAIYWLWNAKRSSWLMQDIHLAIRALREPA